MKRDEIAVTIVERLERDATRLATEFATAGRVRTWIVDDLLPADLARRLFDAFPPVAKMDKRTSLRESKYFAAQIDRYDPLLAEILFALQDERVVRAFAASTGLDGLEPDPRLYAGGISTMVKGSFLNPHLDNSHDSAQKLYRVLNSLYYATPDWEQHNGGNLELWDRGPRGTPRTITSRFNRLVMMETNRASWHSVSPVVVDRRRTCVSNYYFRAKSPEATDYFHATSFRGRPNQRARDLLLRADNALRTRILSVVKIPTRHIYKPKGQR